MRFVLLAIFVTSSAGAQITSDDVMAYLTERRAEFKGRQELNAAANDLMRVGAYSAAEGEFRRLGDRDDVSVALLAQGRIEEAMDPAPYKLDSLYYVATAIEKLGREDLAVRVCNKALEAGENQAEIYRFLGDIYSRKREWDAALTAYRKAHELQPKNRLAALALAGALAATGHREEADAELRGALGVDPNDSADLAREARVILASNGDLDLALVCIQRARGLSPENPEFSDLYGQILTRKGLAPQAVPLFQSLIARAPRNPQYHLHLARALVGIGNSADALSELKTALDCDPPEELQPEIRALRLRIEQ